MKLLYDAVLPRSLAEETRHGMELIRWDGGAKNDTALVVLAADRGYSGVIFFERDSLEQPELRVFARENGVALVGVEAGDPFEAKQRIVNNLLRIRSALGSHDCILVMSRSADPFPG